MTLIGKLRDWTTLGPALTLFAMVLFFASPALPYGGGGGGGGGGDVGRSGNESMHSHMEPGVIGYFFGVPIRMIPVETPAPQPTRDIPTIGPMSEETRQELMWEELQESIQRSQEAGYHVTKWTVLLNGAYAIEFAGDISRFTLNFVPGVGWTTNAGLSALNGGVKSFQQHGGELTGEVVYDASVSGAFSAIASNVGPGRDANIAWNNAQGLKNIGFATKDPARSIKAMDGALSNLVRFAAGSTANVGKEAGITKTYEYVREQSRNTASVPTHRAWESRDMYGRDLKQ